MDSLVEVFSDGLWMMVLGIGLFFGLLALIVIDSLTLLLVTFKKLIGNDNKE